jgi:hypothetical protein
MTYDRRKGKYMATATLTQEEEQVTVQQDERNTIAEEPRTDEAESASLTAEDSHEEQAAEIHLPDPSIWPLVIAVGTAILMAGIILHLWMVLGGVLMLFIGIGGWLYQDVQVARRGGHH